MLRKLALLTLILFFCLYSNAQKFKRKIDVNKHLKEVYFIEKKSKIRQGKSYTINTNTKDTIAIGEYRNGAREGKWKFAQTRSGKPYLNYNYSDQKLLFIDEEILADSFLVWNNGTYEKQAVERPLLYTGFKDEIPFAVMNNISISFADMESGISGLSILQFNVDEKGNITGTKLLSSISSKIDQKINATITQLPGCFLPTIQNGKPVKSAFFVSLNIGMPRENFAQLNAEPYVKHIDFLYGTSPTVEKRRVGSSIQAVSGEELERMKNR